MTYIVYSTLKRIVLLSSYTSKVDDGSNRQNFYGMRSPFLIWKEKFVERHQCTEEEFISLVIASNIPQLLSILFVCTYVTCSSLIFILLDDSLKQEPFYEILLFSFTTVTTIGYGKIVPLNPTSKMFCVLYCVIGIPMVFIALSNVGKFFAQFYWISIESLSEQKLKSNCDDDENEFPLPIVSLLLLIHSLLGGLIFHYWIDEMPFISAVYFSFISITTIGFGDLNPTPDNAIHTLVLIAYLSVGIIIMSTLFGAISCCLRDYSKTLYDMETIVEEETPLCSLLINGIEEKKRQCQMAK